MYKTFEIKSLDDIYQIQDELNELEKNGKVKWAALELANNILEFNRKGFLYVNNKLIIVSIDKKNISKESIKKVKSIINDIQTNQFDKYLKQNNQNGYGGMGFYSIFLMGFKYKIMDLKNKFLIACKLKENG